MATLGDPTMAAADAAASSLGISLGLSDPSLDECKPQGRSIAELQAEVGRRKRPKVTHSLFFEDDRGLKKMLRTFPSIKVRGKGHEYEDVTLLLQHYKKWFADLYPHGDHFEDLVLKARSVLEEKEKEDDGTISDPRERLHAFRFQYKNSPAENKAAPAKAGAQLSDEVRAKIEASRKRALEIKRQREAKNNASGEAPTTSAAPEELDMEELWRMEEERAAATRLQGTSQLPAPDGFDEEDPFEWGGGLDDDGTSFGRQFAARPASQARAPPSFDEEEDVFGYGGGFDDFGDAPAPKKMANLPGAAPEVAPAAAKPAIDPEVARRIADNRAKALARKAAAAAAASGNEAATPATTAAAAPEAGAALETTTAKVPEAAAAPQAPVARSALDEENAPAFDEEMEPFDDFGFGGFDDP